MTSAPQATLLASASLYPLLSRLLCGPRPSSRRYLASSRAISTLHSTLTTLLALYILKRNVYAAPHSVADETTTSHGHTSSLIERRSQLANALTAIETGYLLSSVPSLLHEARLHGRKPSKTMLVHHLGIGSALLVLQYYILRGKEKGIYIIAMFLLMNASTPFLNVRWAARTYLPDKAMLRRGIDLAFVVAFFLARVALVPGVVEVYGRSLGKAWIETWQNEMRWQCKLGTGALWLGNAAWWLSLVKESLAPARSKAATL